MLHAVEKSFASKSYRSGHKQAVIASDSYCSGNILAIIAFIMFSINNTLVEKTEDISCNVLLLKITIGALCITIGSIYGPNNDENTFFNFVQENVNKLNSHYTILGGGTGTQRLIIETVTVI